MDQAELKKQIEEKLLWHYLKIDATGKLVNPPKTDDELHEFIRLALGLSIPRKIITPGHSSPFSFIADQFFERTKDVLGFASRNSGKALAIDTPVLTPLGWRTMEDIEIGDYVFGPDGQPTRVNFVSDVMRGHQCYRVVFRSGYEITADADHLWEVLRPRGGVEILTTEQMANSDPASEATRLGYKTLFAIEPTEPVSFPDAELPIPPYVLGAWLGDGARNTNYIYSWDEEVGQRLIELWPGAHADHYKKDKRYKLPGLNVALMKLGIANKLKFIPNEYLMSGVAQRIELLRGLMDTDGYADLNRSVCVYSSADEELALGVLFLARSLGLIPTMRRKRTWCSNSAAGRVRGQDAYIVAFKPSSKFNPFHLTRKARRVREPARAFWHTHRIKTIQEVDSVPVKCIGVEHPRHLYLAGEALVPTHNTQSVAILNFLDVFFKHGCEITSAGAVLSQADKCYQYFQSFFERPWFKKWAQMYQKTTGRKYIIKDIQSSTQLANGSSVEIITASDKGFRGPHPSKSRVDEIDIIEWPILQVGLSMSTTRNGIRAQNTFTSTRQLPDGPMQKLIDEAEKRGIRIYQWNVWEALEKCPRRCKDDPVHGDCPIFDFCKGKAHHCAGFYAIDDFIGKVRMLDKETFETEWLNEKPSRNKLVYPMFDPVRHVIGPEQLRRMTGFEFPQRDWVITSAIDFGSSPGHPFAYIKLARLPSNGAWLIFYEYLMEQDLLRNHAKAIKSSPLYRPGENPFADHDAQDRLELAEYGVRTRPAIKDVDTGIDYVKSLLSGFPPTFTPALYVWYQCVNTIKEFNTYQRKLMADGTIHPTGGVLKENDHLCLRGDTKILVRGRGWLPISEVPDSSGQEEVWTPYGWSSYVGPAMTREDAELLEVRFSDGSVVVGTPDHLVLTDAYLYERLDSLKIGSRLLRSICGPSQDHGQEVFVQRQELLSLRQLLQPALVEGGSRDGRPIQRIPTPRGLASSARAHSSWDGHPSQGSRSSEQCSKQFGTENEAGSHLRAYDTRAESIRESAYASECVSESESLALDARGSGLARSAREANVGRGCLQDGDVSGVWQDIPESLSEGTWTLLPQQLQGSRLPQAACCTRKADCDQQEAVEVVSIGVVPNADAWDISVPDVGCFVLENGVVSHNCDALRYALMSYKGKAKSKVRTYKVPGV